MLLNIEVFTHSSSLDLNMGYFQIDTSSVPKHICNILLPWGNYNDQKILNGVFDIPDIFQVNISEIFGFFDIILAFIESIIFITKYDSVDHLKALENVLQKTTEMELKISAEQSLFRSEETKYLGLWVSKTGVNNPSSKLEAIKTINSIDSLAKVHGVSCFVGFFHYYREIWRKRVHTLASLTKF